MDPAPAGADLGAETTVIRKDVKAALDLLGIKRGQKVLQRIDRIVLKDVLALSYAVLILLGFPAKTTERLAQTITMSLTLIYFAVLRDLVGMPEERIDWAPLGTTVDQLVALLLEKRNTLSMAGVRIAVNEEFAEGSTILNDGDIVAFIPPVSGG